jgi:hypothetical protein
MARQLPAVSAEYRLKLLSAAYSISSNSTPSIFGMPMPPCSGCRPGRPSRLRGRCARLPETVGVRTSPGELHALFVAAAAERGDQLAGEAGGFFEDGVGGVGVEPLGQGGQACPQGRALNTSWRTKRMSRRGRCSRSSGLVNWQDWAC